MRTSRQQHRTGGDRVPAAPVEGNMPPDDVVHGSGEADEVVPFFGNDGELISDLADPIAAHFLNVLDRATCRPSPISGRRDDIASQEPGIVAARLDGDAANAPRANWRHP